MTFRKVKSESGFTLIEILVVILIIGVLAAIAIPVFMNQRKEGMRAGLQSDLKNAALTMESEQVNNNGKFFSYLPNYTPRTNGIRITLDQTASSSTQFCLIGISENYADIKYYYDSTKGGILKQGDTCTPISGTAGGSFSTALASKKALIVTMNATSGPATSAKTFLSARGFGTVDIKVNPPASDYSGYDLIFAPAANGAITPEIYGNLSQGYNQGAKILTDGNDTTRGILPNFINTATTRTDSSTVSFNQTGAAGLSPAFPYTFTEPAWGSDSYWVCPTAMMPGVVVIADGPGLTAGSKCITASAIQQGEGRWVHLIQAPLSKQDGVVGASINWLMM